ncbi:MAG: anti-sigma factor [Bacteroidota bacterium]
MNEELRGILESDLLERYLLGEVSEQEKAKVLELRRTSPEIRQALDELEKTLEQVALEEEIKSPPGLRDKILRQDYNPAPKTTTSQSSYFWLAYAAGLLLIGGSVWFWQQQRINELETQATAYSEQIAQLESDCQKTNRELALINAPDTRPMILKGTDYAPGSAVIVYWNPSEKACLLRVADLPDIPADKTYQLWADIDGEMNSLGTFDHQSARDQLVAMAYLDHAESLNVTVEPAGGNDHATVSTLSAVVGI